MLEIWEPLPEHEKQPKQAWNAAFIPRIGLRITALENAPA